jgi:hypothetical protein
LLRSPQFAPAEHCGRASCETTGAAPPHVRLAAA